MAVGAHAAQMWTEALTQCMSRVTDLVQAMKPVVGPLLTAPKGPVLEELSKSAPAAGDVACASWYLRRNMQVCCWAVSALGELAAAARTEDAYGVMQLREPTLGTVTSSLLSCLVTLRVRPHPLA